MPVQLTCPVCGRVFSVLPSKARRGHTYCSLACYGVTNRERSGPRSSSWKGGKPILDKKSGYLYVSVRRGRAWHHRVVWETAHGPIPPGHHVHHINGVKTDNRLENLALIDARTHSRLHGFAASKGERNHSARLTEAQVRAIRARHAAGGVTQTALAREYGIHLITVSQIVRRLTWKHID